MKKYFITGAGTGVGKTYVTSLLCSQLVEKGYNVKVSKPVISGWEDDVETDTTKLLKAVGLPVNQKNIHSCSPWRFRAPVSPDMAARKENRKINFNELIDFCLKFGEKEDDYALIEGAGGLMVPVTENKTILDLLVRVRIPIIVVGGSYLGAINHMLTTLAVLEARKLNDVRVVVSESAESTVSLEETKSSIQKFCNAKVFSVPRGWQQDITNIIG